MEDNKCPNCGAEARFVGYVAAPGRGTSYHCDGCDRPLLLLGGTLFDYDNLSVEDIEMQPWEVM
jgi:hypothetical protein